MRVNPDDLWLPPSTRRDEFRKADPPKLGPAFGHWAGRDLTYLQLPGGAIMQFDLSRLTLSDFRQMRHHYQVSISLTVLTFMMHQIEWTIECERKEIANEVEEQLQEVWTRLVRAMSQAFWAGFSPCALEWENNSLRGRIELTKIKDLVPEECAVNWKEVKGYAPRGKARPTFYEYDGIKQLAGSSQIIDPLNTLWYPLLMENGDYYGRKLLKTAFAPWFFSILIHLFSNRYFERFGEPLPIGRADFEDTVIGPDGNAMNGRDAMAEILQNFRNRSVVVLPSDRIEVGDSGRNEYAYDIEYLESQMRGADFERYLTRLDEEISLSLFTPLLMMRTADVGSHNLGTTHAQMYLWMINALAGDMKEYIDRYIVKRIKDFNFGERAPKAKWKPRKLGKENVETFRAVLQELVRGGQVRPDLVELGQAVGMSLEEVKQVTEPSSEPEVDPRIARQDNPGRRRDQPRSVGDPAQVSQKIAARVRQQFANAKRRGETTFVPDWGHRRAVEELIGEAQAADLFSRLDGWAREAYAIADTADEFGERVVCLLRHEL